MKKLILLSAIISSQTLMAQNVGIGLTVPLSKLHIQSGVSGAVPYSLAPLTVESNDHTFINILSPAAKETGILFGIPGIPYDGAIDYNNLNTLNGFQFRTNGNLTRMVIDNTGNVGIGTAAPAAKLEIIHNGFSTYGTALLINQDVIGNADGPKIQFKKTMTSPKSWTTGILNGVDIGTFGISEDGGTGGYGTPRFTIAQGGNVGIGTATPDASAKMDVISTTKGFLPPRMTQVERNNIVTPVAALMIWCRDCGVYGQMQVYDGMIWKNMTGGTPAGIPTVGDSEGGGIIAYVLQPGDPGYVAGQVHGLIAGTGDLGTGYEWGCAGTLINGTSTALGTGQSNTTAIVNGCGTAGIAARICNDLVQNGYSDWYLPSKDELNKLYLNRFAIGGFGVSRYWSSSEFDLNAAWWQSFDIGVQSTLSKSNIHRVRAVRAF